MAINSVKTITAKPKEDMPAVKVDSAKLKLETKPKDSVSSGRVATVSKTAPEKSSQVSVKSPAKVQNKETIKKSVAKNQVSTSVNRVEEVQTPRSRQPQPTITKRDFNYTNQMADRRSRPMAKQPTVRNKLTEEEQNARNNARSAAVRRAWAQEKKLVELGGGSRAWRREERAAILSDGKISGYEGHHIKNVAEHERYASDPRNIVFLKADYHDKLHQLGDATTGNLIDREKMIRKAEQYSTSKSNQN